jgi:hypothetical protein
MRGLQEEKTPPATLFHQIHMIAGVDLSLPLFHSTSSADGTMTAKGRTSVFYSCRARRKTFFLTRGVRLH